MEFAQQKTKRNIGEAITAFFVVALLDCFVVSIALLFLMGDHASTVPEYDYWRETNTAIFILLAYSAAVLGLGFRWHRTRRRTGRLIGMTFGVLPVIVIAIRFLSHLIFGNL